MSKFLTTGTLLALLSGCGLQPFASTERPHGGESPGTVSPNPQLPAPLPPGPPAPPSLVMIGRIDARDANNTVLAWPNSTIGARFSGTSLAVRLSEPRPYELGGLPLHNWYNVVIDDAAPIAVAVNANQRVYPLATNLASGPHTVWMSKRTDARVGPTAFAGFDFGAEGQLLSPPPVQARRIEVIGASGASGYGNEGDMTWPDTICHFTPDTENADLAFPKLTANALQADVVNLSYQGKGVGRNYSPQDKRTAPVYYERTLPDVEKPAWDFGRWVPDVVIIAMGANDLVGDVPPTKQDVVDAYVDFVHTIRGRNPEAPIVIATGPAFGGDDPPADQLLEYFTAAVQTLNAEGDAKVSLLAFDRYNGDKFGCDYHPSKALHAMMAAQLTTHLKQILGW